MNQSARNAAKPYAPGNIAQSIAGRDDSILWVLIDEIEIAFAAEAASVSGKEMLERIEVTNAALRTAWPFVLKALMEKKDGKKSGQRKTT